MPENYEKPVVKCIRHHGHPSEAIYGFGVIGAAVYYLQHATSFTTVVIGIVKAIGWPAVLLYRIMELLRL